MIPLDRYFARLMPLKSTVSTFKVLRKYIRPRHIRGGAERERGWGGHRALTGVVGGIVVVVVAAAHACAHMCVPS